MLVGLVSASQDSLGTFKQNEDAKLIQICGTCTFNTITSIILPNSTHVPIDTNMTKRGAEFTYTFGQTDLIGKSRVSGFGDLDGTNTAWAYEFDVTENGLEVPPENIVIVYSILFFIMVIFMLLTLYNNLIHLASNDTDLKDIAFSYGSFLFLLTYFYFANIYFPKSFVMDMATILMSVTGFTHLFVPPVSLIFATIQRGKIE